MSSGLWITLGSLLGILVFVGLVILFVQVIMPGILLKLGSYDEMWIPIRKQPPEGQMYVILRGGDTSFDKVLDSVPEYEFNPETNDFDHTGKPRGHTGRGYLGSHGLAWVGFNRGMLRSEIKYDKWERSPTSEKWVLVSKTRKGEAIYFQYLMAVKIENAETSGNFPVDVIVTFTVRIKNPVKALFFAGGWVAQVTAAVQGVVREYISTRSIEELRDEKVTGGSNDLIGRVCILDLDQFGLEIIQATFVDYDLVTGGPAGVEMANAVVARKIAGENSAAKVITARGDALAKVLNARGTKLADYELAKGTQALYKARVDGGGEQAGALALAEAIGNGNIQALGGDILSQVMKMSSSSSK